MGLPHDHEFSQRNDNKYREFPGHPLHWTTISKFIPAGREHPTVHVGKPEVSRNLTRDSRTFAGRISEGVGM
jgi:hypothetical protein